MSHFSQIISLANMNPTEIFNFVHYTQSSRKDGGELVLGIGIFADHYFVTAGHVAEMGDFNVMHDGKEYLFRKEDAIFLDSSAIVKNGSFYDLNPHNFDLAIFPSEVKSPIRLGTDSIAMDEILECYTYFNHSRLVTSPASSTPLIFREHAEVFWIPQVSQVKDLTVCDNFIEGTTDILMGEGNSGSPLLRGNELVGILTGNKDSNNLHRIWFCMCNF